MTRYEQLQAEQAEKRKKLNARKIGVDNLATLKDEREDVPTSIRARIDADIAKGREAEKVKQIKIQQEREAQDKYTSKYVPSTNVLDVMKSKVDSAMGVDSTKMVPNKTPHVSDINRSAANVDYSREAVAAKEQFIRENPTIGMTPLEKATYNAQKYNPLAVSDMLVNKAGAGAVQFGAELADAAIAPLKGSGAVYPTAQTTKELWSKQEPGNALTDYISNAKKTLGTVQAARTDYYLNGGTLQDKADSYTAKLDAKFANLTDTAVTKALSDLSQSIGYMVPVQIANMILPNAGTALLYASGYASGERQALQAGGTPDEAKAYAYLNGLNQSLGEMLVGGVLGKGAGAIDTLLKKAGVDIASKIANPTIKAWANAIVRALGEAFEEGIQNVADVGFQQATYKPDAKIDPKGVAYDMLLGGLMSGVYGAPGMVSDAKALKLPSVQTETNPVRVSFAERNAADLSRINADLSANLRTADGEEQLARLKQAKTDTERTGILAGASEQNIQVATRFATKGNLDIEFYREDGQNGTIKDGFTQGGKIYINAASNKASSLIISHELLHNLEQTKGYDAFKKYVSAKVDLKANVAQLTDMYQRAGIELNPAEVESEAMAKYAETIFDNEAEIYNLVRTDRTLGEKILAWIDGMIKKLTGTDEEKYLLKAKELYGRALAEARQDSTVKGDTVMASVSEDIKSDNFKKWFGDWENDPDKASKTVDKNGMPMVLYHQTANDFTTFDVTGKGAGASDYETPYGIFLKSGSNDIGLKGKKQMPLYADIKNPLVVADRTELNQKLSDLSPEIIKIFDKVAGNDELYQQKFREAKDAEHDYLRKWRENNPNGIIREDKGIESLFDKTSNLLTEWTESNKILNSESKNIVTQTLKSAGYDGVRIVQDKGSFGRTTDTYIALNPTQIKSATANIGTYDAKNPDIRYSISKADDDTYMTAVNNGDTDTAQKMVDEAADKWAGGKALVGYHGTNKQFNAFDAKSGLYWFSEDSDYAEEMAYVRKGDTVKKTYLNIQNPYVATLKPGEFSDPSFERPIINRAKKDGHDGIIISTDTDDDILKGTFYVVFNPSQIKSADAITYDDSGNVIPLSQRFNPDNPDIRYSVSKDNSDYFRKRANSAKIRAEQIKDIETWEEPNGKYANRYNDEMTEKRLDNELKELEDEQTETPDPLTLPSVKQKNPLEIDNVKELLSETNDLPPVTEEMEQEYEFAKGMVGNGISYNRDISRNLDSAAGKNKALRDKLHELIEKPFYVAKKNYADEVSTRLNKLKLVMDKLGIKQGSKESAAVQWIGEGSKQGIDGKPVPYTEADLTRDFPKTYKKILTAERYCRELYSEYIGRINQALEKVYPNAVENVTREQIKYASAEMFYAGQADLLGEQIKTLESTIAKKEAELSKAKPETTKYVTLKTSINYNKNRVETKKRVLDKYKAISERSGVLARQLQKDIDTGDALRNKRLMPRKDYYHHFNEIESGFGGLVNLISTPSDIDSLLAGTSEFTKPKSKWAGFLQQRQNGKYTEDAVGGLTKYIPAAEYKIALDPIIAEGRAHIQGIATATTETRNANKFLTWYTDFVNSLAGKTNPFDRVVQKVASRKALAVLRFINTRAKKNAVVGNVRSAIAQFFNLPNAAGLIKNPVDWMAGGKLFTENLIGRPDATALLDASGFLTERYLDSAIRQFDESILKSPSKLFAWMLEAGDKQAAKLIWSAAYSNATRTKKADPILYADDITRRTVAGRGIGEVPLAQQAIITQFVAPFQIEVNNAWQLLKDKWRDKDIYGIFAIFLMSWLMNSLVRELFGFDVSYDPINAAHESIKEWDSKSTTYDNVMNVAGRQAGELISNIPFGSTVSQYVISDEYQREKLFGDSDPTRFGTGNIGLNMFVDPIIEIINGDDYTDELLSAVLNLTLPYGGKQAEKILKGLQDIGIAPRVSDVIGDNKAPEIETKAGSYSASGGLRLSGPEQPADIAKTLVLGSLSTKAGQEYLESDSRPLSDKNTEIYEKVTAAGANGLYVNKVIRETQSKDKSEDKRDTLMSSPLNPDHKLLLYRQMLVQDEWNEAKLIDRLSGMTSSQQVLDTIVKYKDLNASKMKAGEKALDWQLWVDKQGFSATQKAAIDEYISFRVALPVEPTAYEKFTESGMDIDTAYDLADSISKLEPMEGQKAVSTLQRYRVIADAEISDKDKLRAMSVLMSETGYKALARARLKGLKVDSYVKYLEGTADIVSDVKNGETIFGSRKQKVLTLIDRMILTKAQKDLLYDIEGYSAGTIDDAPWHGGERYDGDIHQRKVNGRQLRPLR